MPATLLSRLLLWLLAMALVMLSACTPATTDREGPVPDSRELAAAIAKYGADVPGFDQLRSVVVATDHRIVFEKYYGTDPDKYWALASVTKSVVSTLIGIALDEGLLGSLDDSLAELLPRYAHVMSPAVARTTLRQLLTMTAGFPGDFSAAPDFSASRNWVRQILTHPGFPPGERFLYSDAGAHLLSAVLVQATGVPVLSYARSELFEPLGIESRPAWQARAGPARIQQQAAAYYAADFAWPRDPQGLATGWWGLRLRPRDMVELGQLYLADGRWNGRQVVSRSWVHEATTQQVSTDGLDGYGYEWWTGAFQGHDVFRAMGFGGQLIEVVPDLHLVIAATTEVSQDDPTSQGMDVSALASIVEEAVVAKFPSD